MSRQFYLWIFVGILIIILCVIFNLPSLVWIAGFTFLLFGLLFLGVIYYAGKTVLKEDLIAQSKVAWKTIGFDRTVKALEDFLIRFPEPHQRETKDLPKGLLWKNPEVKFLFPNGNFISSMYTEDESGNVFGWVAVGYTSKNYLHARTLQKNLDRYLTERDLIKRAV